MYIVIIITRTVVFKIYINIQVILLVVSLDGIIGINKRIIDFK